MAVNKPKRRFRSQDWFDDPARMDMVALYLERYMNTALRRRSSAPAGRSSASRNRAAISTLATACISNWRSG